MVPPTPPEYLFEANGLGPTREASERFREILSQAPAAVLERMRELEAIDARDREDGTPRMERLRQVPPATGRFIAELALDAPEGAFVEIGTSAGYSTLWLALAMRARGSRITTYEILEAKHRLASETFRAAGVMDVVEPVFGDALEHIAGIEGIAFCFLDAEKEIYEACYDLVVPRLAPGGLLVGDNAINHYETLAPMIDHAKSDHRVVASVVPIEKGELICRKV
jgi:predicted O-methyltransferase YrrM